MKYFLGLILCGAILGFLWKKDIRSIDDLQAFYQSITGQQQEEITDENTRVEKAFRKNQLFAVTSKEFIPPLSYDKQFQETKLGGQAKGTYPPVYVVKCMGRETRETFIFIVGYKFYNSLMMHQKLTPSKLSPYAKYLSEVKFRDDLYQDRFRFKMID